MPAALDALNRERLRTQLQMTEKLKLENAMTKGELLRRSEVMRVMAVIADAVSTRINAASEVPREVRDDILREIATWPLALKEAEHAQTRLKTKAEKANEAKAKADHRARSARVRVRKGVAEPIQA